MVPTTPSTPPQASMSSDQNDNVPGSRPGSAQPASEVDLQARAAEEFQKGLRTSNDDSSDEDEGAKPTKPKFRIQINAKPTGGSAVDANLLRAATQQFKIGDGLTSGRPSVSRPPQDFFPGEINTLALPPPVSSSMAPQQFPPMMLQPEGGVGQQGSSPIPEDFWKQTIPATAVAKAFEATGTLLPQAQPQSAAPVPPQQPSYELPGGGVPPQQPETAGTGPHQLVPSLPGVFVPPQAPPTPPLQLQLEGNFQALGSLGQDPRKKELVDVGARVAPPPVSQSAAFVKRNQVMESKISY